MNRDIEFGMPIQLRPKLTRTMGLREAVLIGGAALQALWLIFIVQSWPFALRASIAMLVAIVLLTITAVPFWGMRFEIFVLTYLRYLLRPKQHIHMTAWREWQEAQARQEQANTAVEDSTANAVIPKARAAAPALSLDWAAPDPALVMFVFVVLLVAGSVIAYVGRGGHF